MSMLVLAAATPIAFAVVFGIIAYFEEHQLELERLAEAADKAAASGAATGALRSFGSQTPYVLHYGRSVDKTEPAKEQRAAF
jgi:hypothetical protein